MASQKVDYLLNSDVPVVIFSKTYCGYCSDTKNIFQSLGVSFEVLELDEVQNGGEIQSVLTQRTNQRTVPYVFIGKKFIGGNSNVRSLLQTQQLVNLLRSAGAKL